MKEEIIMHIDMNAYFASIEQKANPALRGKPVIVCGDPSTRTTVATASYEARLYGVESGMPLSLARRKCPRAVLIEGNGAKYIDTSRRLVRIFLEFTPRLEVFSIDEVFLDVSGSLHLFGSPRELAGKIKMRIKEELGLTCSVGIGPNKLVAKLASGFQKPDGLVLVKPGEVKKLLADLPVSALCGVGKKTREKLRLLGIQTCGELGRAPLKLLKRSFGIIGEVLKKMGQGTLHSPVQFFSGDELVKSMGHSCTLVRDTSDFKKIKATLLRLSEKVGRRLRKDYYSGKTVTLVFRYSDFSTFTRAKTLKEYINDGFRIYSSALKVLEGIDLENKKLRMIGVSVSNLLKDISQLPLLEELKKKKRILEAMDRVNNKYGEFTLARALLLSVDN